MSENKLTLLSRYVKSFDGSEDEDVDDIQLAWEAFEMARKAFELAVADDEVRTVKIVNQLEDVYTRLGKLLT